MQSFYQPITEKVGRERGAWREREMQVVGKRGRGIGVIGCKDSIDSDSDTICDTVFNTVCDTVCDTVWQRCCIQCGLLLFRSFSLTTITWLDLSSCHLLSLPPILFKLSSLLVLKAADNELSLLPDSDVWNLPHLKEV